MPFEPFDSSVFTPEEFPVLCRLSTLLAAGHALDDVIAGMAHVQPRLDATVGAELTTLINTKEQYEVGRDLSLALLPHAQSAVTRYICKGNVGYCEDKLGNTARGLEFTHQALAELEDVDEPWVSEGKAWACNQVGWSKFHSGELDVAVEWARRAIEHSATSGNAHGTLGSALYELGDDAAYEAFEEAMKLGVNPKKPARLKDDARYQKLAAKYDIPLPEGD